MREKLARTKKERKKKACLTGLGDNGEIFAATQNINYQVIRTDEECFKLCQ